MFAGQTDLERAARALATRLPEPLGALAQLPLGADARRPRALPARSTPTC